MEILNKIIFKYQRNPVLRARWYLRRLEWDSRWISSLWENDRYPFHNMPVMPEGIQIVDERIQAWNGEAWITVQDHRYGNTSYIDGPWIDKFNQWLDLVYDYHCKWIAKVNEEKKEKRKEELKKSNHAMNKLKAWWSSKSENE